MLIPLWWRIVGPTYPVLPDFPTELTWELAGSCAERFQADFKDDCSVQALSPRSCTSIAVAEVQVGSRRQLDLDRGRFSIRACVRA
jgi:hypothetical protein